ncbi:molybdopterin converting factor subunit 1 [Sphingobium sp. H39-3-25]|uniref:molybdopterin converting factor subunit 1 n=1 Tax=Sphingobium arseniciresistens TaxID=3030834 RepID=UPI0023B8BFB5|nr:molybdopterin converting factor subunit 1 [Sphingobium arseniciresistens]
MTQLSLIYFAWVREAVGRDSEQISLPREDMRVADVIAMLAAQGGGYAEAFAQPDRLRAALDQQFVPMETLIGKGRELALFPPVTGG